MIQLITETFIGDWKMIRDKVLNRDENIFLKYLKTKIVTESKLRKLGLCSFKFQTHQFYKKLKCFKFINKNLFSLPQSKPSWFLFISSLL